MVESTIQGAKLDIWADAPSEVKLVEIVQRVLEESADEVKVWGTELEEAGNKELHFQVFFDVFTDGMFIGELVADEMTEKIQENEWDEYPTISYTRADESELENRYPS